MSLKTFLETLNPEQYKAVTAPLGTQLIIAGAGSGKTRVITARIAYLMQEYDVSAHSILAMTFTNKAGKEMQERIGHLCPNAFELPFVGTFHSYCLKLLKQNSNLLKLSHFSLIDSEDQKAIIKKLIKQFGLEKQTTASQVQHLISYRKNHTTLPPAILQGPQFFTDLYSAYEEEKEKSHAFDFDDLLCKTLELFTQNPHFKFQFQENTRHLLVDEYQDTNQVQHALLCAMALNNEKKCVMDSVCAVGDEDQSIYSWRGAQADSMHTFIKDFSPTLIKIEQNYRSVQPILEAANHIIKNNPGRTEKKLWSDKPASQRITVLACQTAYQEADYYGQIIKNRPSGKQLKDFAFLYRTHHQSRILEEACMRHAIPYVIVGGLRFYERQEIKDLLAYLRLFHNSYDRTSFLRIANVPARSIGDKCKETLITQWDMNPFYSLPELLHAVLHSMSLGFTTLQKTGITQLYNLFSTPFATLSLRGLVEHIIRTIGYKDYIKKHHEQKEAETKLDNIDEFLNALTHFEQENPNSGLDAFLEEVALMQEQSHKKVESDYVSLMTLHAAKGLEFDTVFIPGLEEELFPSGRAFYNPRELEEERRLFYVGITRAREYATMSYCQSRQMYGRIQQYKPSRFLSELPPTLVTTLDLTTGSFLSGMQKLGSHFGFSTKPAFSIYSSPPQKAKPPFFSQQVKSIRSRWKRNMPVKHPQFGVGIIESIDKRSEDEYYLTIQFKNGKKRLSSKFVSAA